MNTMKSFYASISSTAQPRGPYLEALSEITEVNRRQTHVLMSDMGWQQWGEQNQKIATNQT